MRAIIKKQQPNDTPDIDSFYQFGGLFFEELRYPHAIHMPFHAHVGAQFVFVLQGAVQNCWRQQTMVTKGPALFYLPPQERHSTYIPENIHLFQVSLTPSWQERLQQYSALTTAPALYQNGLPMWLATRLYSEYQRRDDLTPLMLEGMLLELLAQISRDTNDRSEKHIPLWLKETRDFLHAHFTEKVSLETIASAVGVHPAHLTRAFRQHYHCSLGDYLRRLRVEYACHLLSCSPLPLVQIAIDAGFADQSHFSRTFKQYTGMSPTDFQRHKQGAVSKKQLLR